jgi:2'-5' RNA ligase
VSGKGAKDEIRAFIAVELSSSLRDTLGELQEDLKRAGVEARWVRPQGIHLTLKFLGNIAAEQVQAVRSAMEEAVHGSKPIEARAGGVGAFPNERRPRVVWVGLEEPTGALVALQKRLDAALKPLGFKPENRPFKAHLTIARIKSPGRGAEVARALADQEDVDFGKIVVDKIVLYKSTLKPTGAMYTRLEEVALEGG